MVNRGEPLINVVTSNKPKRLTGLNQKVRGQVQVLLIHLSQMVHPGEKAEPKRPKTVLTRNVVNR